MDQGNYPTCTAFESVATKEATDGVAYSPEYFTLKEGEKMGWRGEPWEGCDLRVKMQVGVDSGFLPKNIAPVTFSQGIDLVLSSNNWDEQNLDPIAKKNAYKSYWTVHAYNGMDLFDSMRSTLWNIKGDKMSVCAGLMFYESWLHNPIMGAKPLNAIGLHDIKVAGWKKIDGDPYLVLQNSFGTQYGDNGLFYMSRPVANKFLNQGAYYWSKDDPPPDVKAIGLLITLYERLLDLFRKLRT